MRQLDLFEDTDMGEFVVGSKQQARNGYGQNGFQGPSSDTDLSNPTRSPMSVEMFGPTDKLVSYENKQCRTVSDKQYPAHPGMKGAADGPKLVGHVHRGRNGL